MTCPRKPDSENALGSVEEYLESTGLAPFAEALFRDNLPKHPELVQRWLEIGWLNGLLPPHSFSTPREASVWKMEQFCGSVLDNESVPQEVLVSFAVAFLGILSGMPPDLALSLRGGGPGRPRGGRELAIRDLHLCVEYRKRQLAGETWEAARENTAAAEGVCESTVKNAVTRFGKELTKDLVAGIPLSKNSPQ